MASRTLKRQTDSPLEPPERRRAVLLWASDLHNCKINLCYVTEFVVICDSRHGKLVHLLS